MSGVYIRGMKMPRACVWREDGHLRTCPLYDIDGYCGAINSEACHKEEEHHPDCPAFSVPDHGRLISAKRIEFELCESTMPEKYREFCRRVIRSESLSPTIIPADKEKEAKE